MHIGLENEKPSLLAPKLQGRKASDKFMRWEKLRINTLKINTYDNAHDHKYMPLTYLHRASCWTPLDAPAADGDA
jgi:hypothetical protein